MQVTRKALLSLNQALGMESCVAKLGVTVWPSICRGTFTCLPDCPLRQLRSRTWSGILGVRRHLFASQGWSLTFGSFWKAPCSLI